MVRVVLFLFLFLFLSPLVISQGSPTVPMEVYGNESDINYALFNRVSIVVYFVALILSLLIGYKLSKNIKGRWGNKIPLILHGLIFLGSVIWFVSMIVIFASQYTRLGGVPDPDMIEIGWPLIFPLVFSGFIFFSLLKRKGSNKEYSRMEHYLSMSLLTFIFACIANIFLNIIFGLLLWVFFGYLGEYGLGVILSIGVLFLFGIVFSYFMGLIGFLVDKFKK